MGSPAPVIVVCAALLSGCTGGTDAREPQVPTGDAFVEVLGATLRGGAPMVVTLLSTDDGREVASGETGTDGRAAIAVADGGDITAYVVGSNASLAVTLGQVERGSSYTIRWPNLSPAGPLGESSLLLVTIAGETGSGSPYVRAGSCVPMSIVGTSTSLQVLDTCRSPSDSFYLTGIYTMDPDVHAETFVVAGATAATLTFARETRSDITVSGELPSELQNPGYLSEIVPLHLGVPSAMFDGLSGPSGVLAADFELEHRLHADGADQLATYLEISKPGVSFRSLRRWPVANEISYGNLDEDFCPFTLLDAQTADGAQMISLANECSAASGIAVSLTEGATRWIGIYPPNQASARVPAIPGFVFTTGATLGATFRTIEPPSSFHDPRIWEWSSSFDGTTLNVTRQGTFFGY